MAGDESAARNALGFVKRHPMMLCCVSFLFVPRVYRVLLFFSPLLLSTGVCVLALLFGGRGRPASSSSEQGQEDDEMGVNEFFGAGAAPELVERSPTEDARQPPEPHPAADAAPHPGANSALRSDLLDGVGSGAAASRAEPDPDLEEEGSHAQLLAKAVQRALVDSSGLLPVSPPSSSFPIVAFQALEATA